MAYGMEIVNDNGDVVINQDSDVMVASEKFTVSGIRSGVFGSVTGDSVTKDYKDANDNANWIRQTSTLSSQDVNTGYFTNIQLAANYSNKPIVAIRGKNGAPITLPYVYVYRSGTTWSRLRVYSENPISTDILIITPSAESQSLTIPSGDNYGITFTDNLGSTVFDTRWEEIVAVKSGNTFPTFSSSYDYRTGGGAPTGTSVSTGGETGNFYVLSTVYGVHNVRSYRMISEGISFFQYGGLHYPSLITTSTGISVTPTMVNARLDLSSSSNYTTTETDAGNQITTGTTATGGTFLTIRYLNF